MKLKYDMSYHPVFFRLLILWCLSVVCERVSAWKRISKIVKIGENEELACRIADDTKCSKKRAYQTILLSLLNLNKGNEIGFLYIYIFIIPSEVW